MGLALALFERQRFRATNEICTYRKAGIHVEIIRSRAKERLGFEVAARAPIISGGFRVL